MSAATCYMCDQPATGKEHVPPKCLFPEVKDVGENHRSQLITVPSCDTHNNSKSTDDEFLMVSLAGIIGNNSIGFAHKFTKVHRSFRKNAFKVLNEALKNQRIEWVEFQPNKFIDVVWGTPDFERLNRCFDHIARGLHFHEFGQKFDGETKTLIGFTHEDEPNPVEFKRFMRDKVTSELDGKPRLGANSEIFTYQFTDKDQFDLSALHLQFYGGLDIYVGMVPSASNPPPNFAMELISLGVETILSEGDKLYVFNKGASDSKTGA